MTKYSRDTALIQNLKKALTETVEQSMRQTLGEIFRGGGQEVTGASPFPLYTTKQAAKVFHVSTFTVRDWHRKGLLRGHYQVLSGRTYRLIFTNRDLLTFFQENFPAPEDIGDHPCNPRRGSKTARMVEKIIAMKRLYARRRQPVNREHREKV